MQLKGLIKKNLFWTILFVCNMALIQNGNSQSTNINNNAVSTVRLITLDPGHFHAALVQKSMYNGIDPLVHVYAPGGPELQAHLNLIKQYNERTENPAHWEEQVYTGSDYLRKMLADKAGNVVVLAGNNQLKTEYIKQAIDAGLNVLADKPMAINSEGFGLLEKAFAAAKKNNVLLYDIMTERSEITNILQKEFSRIPEVFGELRKGTVNDPAVQMESVHFFYKTVSGQTLIRPDWFFDPAQQGDALADVGTHLIDLVQWECFPQQVINYKKDIAIHSARTWATPITVSQFQNITKKDAFPEFLKSYVKEDSVLQTHANGEVTYSIKEIFAKVTVRWEYKAPEGSGDTHHSILKGTIASLEIRQDAEENYQPTLYILPVKPTKTYGDILQNAVAKLAKTYPGIAVGEAEDGWKVNIPQQYKVGHEAHFGQVMERYLQYLKDHKMPEWEVPAMLAKYYTATKALDIAKARNVF